LIYINKTQLKQLETLLTQSANGIHLLFDKSSLSKILSEPTESDEFFTFENLNRVQALLGEFLQQSSFEKKRQFVVDLDNDSYELLVRSYFNIVENTVLESTKEKH